MSKTLNLILKDVNHLEDYIEQLKAKFPDKIYISIRQLKGLDASRKEYFARIGTFAEEMGYSKPEMHEFVKDNILQEVTKHKQFVSSDSGINSTSTKSLNEVGYTKLLLSIEEYMENEIDRLI